MRLIHSFIFIYFAYLDAVLLTFSFGSQVLSEMGISSEKLNIEMFDVQVWLTVKHIELEY